jgi:TolB-like protein/Tfp pilus assembly protein PilF
LRYLFEEYTFDTDRRELRRGADVVTIAPQVFDLLDYLIRNRERVVSKDDLISAVWNGRIVSDAALTTRLNAARSAIGDTGEKQRLIKTLPRKGFRFVGTVREAQMPVISPVGSAAESGVTAQRSLSPPRLSIVVLPFANLSGDREQDYFVDGVTESLTTDLSRISGSFVIGRHTAFTYKGKAADLKQIGQELNVRYVLEGSVQQSLDRLRVNVQLVETENAGHLWAERFDKRIADLFEMQDEIVSRLANTLRTELIEAEARRSERRPHPDAMDWYFQGRHWWNRGLTSEYLAQARHFFERSLAIDPANADAMTWMAMVDVARGVSFLTDDSPRYLAAETILLDVLSRAPNHAWAHFVLGALQIYTNRVAQGVAQCERALALDHNLADAHVAIGTAKFFMGRAVETEAHVNEALRLSPRDIFAFRWLLLVGFAKLQLAEDAEAVSWFLRSIEANRNFPIAHFACAAALALLGSLNEAAAAAKMGLTLNPSFTIRRFREGAQSNNATYLAKRERVYEGMRLAGIPER